MADIEVIEVVIKIPQESYNNLKIGCTQRVSDSEMIEAIANGTPLPKGHGALITKEQAIELVEFYQLNPQHFDFVNLIEEIKDEKPIIEADKE